MEEEKKKFIKEHDQTINYQKLQFKERNSYLDNITSNTNYFHGFINLLIIIMVYFFLTNQTRTIMYNGTLIGLNHLISLFSRFDLFPSWLCLVFFSFSSVIFIKFILWNYNYLSFITIKILHYLLQITYFLIFLLLCLKKNWPVVQTGFFIMELLILLMKMHSYIETNVQYIREYYLDNNQNEKKLTFPNNLTFGNFLFFLLIPTLIYQLEYPRTKKIRVNYVIEKLFGIAGIWAILHILVSEYIIPILEISPKMNAIEAISHLIIPVSIFYILIFYIVFDLICNAIAELTKFADREFYSDWWNSTSFDEFARKWNKPVHEWLLRYIYYESISKYHFTKANAAIFTFFLSSLVHEFWLACMLKLIRPWLFLAQMSQLPLMIIGRHRLLKGTRLGNMFFWFLLLAGPPLLSILYCREFYKEKQ